MSLPAPETGGSDSLLGLGSTTATATLAGVAAVAAGGGFLAVRTLRRRRIPEGSADE